MQKMTHALTITHTVMSFGKGWGGEQHKISTLQRIPHTTSKMFLLLLLSKQATVSLTTSFRKIYIHKKIKHYKCNRNVCTFRPIKKSIFLKRGVLADFMVLWPTRKWKIHCHEEYREFLFPFCIKMNNRILKHMFFCLASSMQTWGWGEESGTMQWMVYH